MHGNGSRPGAFHHLGSRLSETDPAELLPARLAAGRHQPSRPASILDALDLADGRWLLVAGEDGTEGVLVAAVVEAGSGFRRALAGDGVAEGLLALIAGGTATGAFTGAPLSSIGAWRGEAPIDVDQANDSTIVGDRAVVKRYVRVAPGNERPIVLPAHLVAGGFSELPTPLGCVTWRGEDGAVAVASATAYLEGARDGWDWFVELVERVVDDRSFEPALEAAASMGSVTARLHAALAAPTDVFPAPRVAASADTVAGWRRDAEIDLDRALASIDGSEGARLRGVATRVDGELDALRADTTPTIPIHGDLHVGQFLRWPGGIAVSDLDGDPLGPGELLGSPARDVASLIQSLDHAARIVERRRPGRSLDGWIHEAAEASLEAYRGELATRGVLDLFDDRLLRPFRVAQELHEFVYAARYLPGWRYVPDAALPALLGATS